MSNGFIKILILFLLISTHLLSYSQNNKIDSLISSGDNETALLELNKMVNSAQNEKDTVAILNVYDYYIKIFENDSLSENEKKFVLQKVVILKSYLNNHPGNLQYSLELIKTYDLLARLYTDNNEFYTAIDIYNRAIFLSEQINDKRNEAFLCIKIAKVYQSAKKFQTAIDFYKRSINRGRELGDSLIVFDNYIFIGELYFSTGEYSNAIYNYYEAFSISQMTDNIKGRAIVYNHLADAFYKLELYDKAIEYSNEALKIYNHNHDFFDDKMLFDRYIFLGKSFLQVDSIDNSIKSFNEALYLAQKTESQKMLATAFCQLGIAYTEKEEYVLAEDFLSKSLLIRQRIGDSTSIIKSKLAFGKYYVRIKDIDNAKFYFINSYKYANKIKDFDLLKDICFNLSEIFTNEKNYELALKYYREYKGSIDSLTKQNNLISVEKLEDDQQLRFTNLLVNQEITYLNQRKKELSLFIILLVVFLVALIVLSVFFIFKIKETARHKNLIEKQKQIILKQYERYKMLSLVASHTDNSIFIMDTDFKVVWVNDALLDLYKTTHYEIFNDKNACFKELTSGDFDTIVKTSYENKESISYMTNIKVGGQDKWVQTTVSPIIEDDKVINLIGIETDISSLKIAQFEIQRQKKDIEYKNRLMDIYNQELKDQKEAIIAQNEELRQQQEELKAHTDILEEYNKELQRLSIVARETDNVVYIFDLNGNMVWVNNAFTKHTGYTFDEYVETHGKNILTASNADAIDYYFYVCVEHKKSVKYVSEFITKFGKKMWMQTTLSPLKNNDGEVVEVVAIDSDITEIKNAERKISEQNKEIKSSLEYAGKIQRSVLPMRIFVKAVFENYFIFNRPRDIVSGDFYFLHYVEDKAIFALADSTGHGIPGAFMSLLGSMALKIVASSMKNYDANVFLNNLNNEIIKLLHQSGRKNGTIDSIDMALCIFDFKTKTLEYAGANIPLFICRKNDNEYSINRIRPSKATIGYDELYKSFTVHSFKLEKGDRVYLASDGLSDQFGGTENKRLKRNGVVNLFERLNRLDIAEQEEDLDRFLKRWMVNNDQVDDILVIGIEF